MTPLSAVVEIRLLIMDDYADCCSAQHHQHDDTADINFVLRLSLPLWTTQIQGADVVEG